MKRLCKLSLSDQCLEISVLSQRRQVSDDESAVTVLCVRNPFLHVHVMMHHHQFKNDEQFTQHSARDKSRHVTQPRLETGWSQTRSGQGISLVSARAQTSPMKMSRKRTSVLTDRASSSVHSDSVECGWLLCSRTQDRSARGLQILRVGMPDCEEAESVGIRLELLGRGGVPRRRALPLCELVRRERP